MKKGLIRGFIIGACFMGSVIYGVTSFDMHTEERACAKEKNTYKCVVQRVWVAESTLDAMRGLK